MTRPRQFRPPLFAPSDQFDAITDELGRGEACPKCGSEEVSERHADGTFALPETDWKQCDECGHQFDHQ